MKTFGLLAFSCLALALITVSISCSHSLTLPPGNPELSSNLETRIGNLRQLSFGGTNAEAYWSFDGRHLSYQAKTDLKSGCDQIFTLDVQTGAKIDLSKNRGRTTCSFYLPDDKRVLWSSTLSAGHSCPPEPDRSRGYVWPVYHSFQMYSTKTDGSDLLPMEPGAPSAYNAEATVCKDGSIVFTSDRDGDLELYTAKLNNFGSLEQIKRITFTPGYDGGAFFSPDCTQLVWRASRPKPGTELDDYKQLLKQQLVRPSQLELWVADREGKHARQITALSAASFAPYFTPDGKHVIFSSNKNDPKGGRGFDLWMIGTNGASLEQVTFSNTFDSFPMFSPDGKYLAFSSNRFAKTPRETNIFVADWISKPSTASSLESSYAPDRAMAVVNRLSDPLLQGRGVGSQGLKEAEAFVATQFEKLGLKPWNPLAQGLARYFDPVAVQMGVEIVRDKTLLKSDSSEFKLETEFVPLGFSAQGTFEGAPILAGYGMVAPELGLNDYANINVKGKIVILQRHTPPSLKLTPAQQKNYSDLRYKTFLARERGAVGVLFWSTESSNSTTQELLKTFEQTGGKNPSGDAGIGALLTSEAVVKKIQQAKKITASVKLNRKIENTHNVVALWGKECGKKPGVLIGAHLDHLGLGAATSLEPTQLGLHPGADDNASGIAALLEVARTLKDSGKGTSDAGCVIFAAFSAEEVGVVGSSQLAEKFGPQSQYKNLKAMINMDMVGRMEENKVIALGVDSASEWAPLLKASCENHALQCQGSGDGYGPSDHMAFYIHDVPVLHFFTGAHADYHRSTDTADKVNATGIVQVAQIVSELTLKLNQLKKPLTFKKAAGASSMGDIHSNGASLGTIPDYTQGTATTQAKGVLLAGVRVGSPSAKAGVTGGDLLIGIEAKGSLHKILSLEDFTFVLASLSPDESIVMVVMRKDKELKLPATVGRRK